jgi:hypothetical protein
MKSFKMKNMRNWVAALMFVFSIGGVTLAITAPQDVYAASPTKDCNSGFLGFPAWYRGLTDSNCNIKSPTNSHNLTSFIWHIALNILEMAIVAVAYLSGFYFLFGGWLFILSQGKPESIAKAKSTMTMALIGLVVSLAAVAIVAFFFSKLPTA